MLEYTENKEISKSIQCSSISSCSEKIDRLHSNKIEKFSTETYRFSQNTNLSNESKVITVDSQFHTYPLFIIDKDDMTFWENLNDKEKQSAIIAERILKCSFNLRKSNIYVETIIKEK